MSVARDEPRAEPAVVVVLAHGAGGDLNDPLLREVGSRLADRGALVVRFNFPYREAGRRAPGSQAQSESCYRDVASSVRLDGLPLFLGGKSYGGRIASHIVADGFDADGLVFLSYPLHPPGKPERLRDEHLARISVPLLFVQGTKDPFARPDLLERTMVSLPNAALVAVDGGDHSLRVRGTPAADVHTHVTDAVAAFVGV